MTDTPFLYHGLVEHRKLFSFVCHSIISFSFLHGKLRSHQLKVSLCGSPFPFPFYVKSRLNLICCCLYVKRMRVCSPSTCYPMSVYVSCCQDCYRVQTPGGGGYGAATGSLRQENDVGDPPSSGEQEQPQHFAACGSLHNYKMMQESA